MKLLQFVPQRQRNGVNGPTSGSWYPAHRPLQGYRTVLGTTLNLNGSVWSMNGSLIYVVDDAFYYDGMEVRLTRPYAFTLNGVTYTLRSSEGDLVWASGDQAITWTQMGPSVGCDPKVVYGPLMKMLKPLGVGATCGAYAGPLHTKGNVFSFSGYSRIRSATTNISSKYCPDTASYLRRRANSFHSTSTLHKAPGIRYVNTDGGIVWPVVPQHVPEYPYVVNSAYYAPTVSDCPTPLRVYKPSNPTFSVQGAVDSSTRILKLRLEAESHKKLSSKKV